MADELPSDPQEREIFLRALRDYSERCEPPDLTSSCPFALEISPNQRGCGEECMDLLAQHGAPGPIEELALGDGLTAIRVGRPRPRRRASQGNAYDARQVYLEDREKQPVSHWRLAAVLRGLMEECCEPPPADTEEAMKRKARLQELLRCTELKGLEPETHVMPNVRLEVAGAVFAHLLGFLLAPESHGPFDRSNGWFHLAEQLRADDSGLERRATDNVFLGRVYSAIIEWSRRSSLEELLEWTPPTADFEVAIGAEPNQQADDDGTWMVERFTKTYLEEWSVPSLRREWRYLHGQHPAPCLPSDMDVRGISESDLAVVMADRLAVEPPPHSHLATRLVDSAAKFIREGRRGEAVALFEATLHLEPDSPMALNNLGFCHLPDDPEAALGALERVAAPGGDMELSKINRALALASLGRFTSALDLIESVLDDADSQRLGIATYLWDIASILQNNEPMLVVDCDMREYAESLWSAVKVRLRTNQADTTS